MKSEKISNVLSRIMLAIFLFIMLFAVGFQVLNLEHKSYMLAFLAAAFIFVLGFLIFRKRNPLKLAEKLGAFKTGLILSIFCFALSLIWVLVFKLSPEGDYRTFWNTASELALGEEISGAGYVSMFPHIMGYSAFLSLFFRIFGVSVMTAAILNVVLTTISGLIIYILCLRWADIKTAALAFLLWAVCPSKTLYNTMVLSEPYYTCVLLCFLLIASYLEGKIQSKKAAWVYALWGIPAALALAAMNSARPIALIPVIAFFIWLLVLRGRALTDKNAWKKWLSFALVLVLVFSLSGKLWNNYMEERLGEEPSGTPGYSIYVGFNPNSLGSYSEDDMDMLVNYRFNVYGSSTQAQQQMLEEAKERIAAGEVSLAKLFSVKLRTLFGNDEGGVFYSRKAMSPTAYSLLAVISNVFYYLVIIMLVFGTIKLWKKSGFSLRLMVPLYVVGLACAHMLVEVAIRYHYSAIPMLIIMAAFSCMKNETLNEGD